jgi:hypothetical protein
LPRSDSGVVVVVTDANVVAVDSAVPGTEFSEEVVVAFPEPPHPPATKTISPTSAPLHDLLLPRGR